MRKKLTLTMDDQIIDSAKEYARKKGENLSGIVENYLRLLSARDNPDIAISARVRKMMGVIKLPEEYNYKKERGSYYGK
jgi:Family of unknown function (DUF6364)